MSSGPLRQLGWRLKRRRPARDGTGALPGMGVVGDAREPAAQLDGGRELAPFLKRGADGGSVVLRNQKHSKKVELRRVAGKRRLGHAFEMNGRRFSWLVRFLPLMHQERARLAKLDDICVDLAAVAGCIRDLSARQGAHAHLIRKVVRANRGAFTEMVDTDSLQNVMLAQAADTLARSKEMAGALDRVAEALKRLAAELRGLRRHSPWPHVQSLSPLRWIMWA